MRIASRAAPRRRNLIAGGLAAVLVASALAAIPTVAGGNQGGDQLLPRSPDADVIPDRYIVIYEDDLDRGVRAETEAREDALGFTARQRYHRALDGFAAKLGPGQLRALERDPEVAFVSQDRRVTATAEVALAAGEPMPPSGVRRIRAATATTAREASRVNVAVIDTGIQLDHPDLNAADGIDCVDPGTPADDGNGHGTHVAGTIGAKNNGAGVVGAAPGTRTYAVRVLDDSGSGTWSQVICGIDWVTANSTALDIGVANMSLGGGGPALDSCESSADALHRAICDSTAAGVSFVVAAGNSAWDFDYASIPDVPAAYPEVLTVTAVADSDGAPGGAGGPPGCRPGEQDDAPASFSNYAATAGGRAHTIAAPGVCIRSTWTGGGHQTISGTSMAAPHMAGIVALCRDEAGVDGGCAGKDPAQVLAHLRDRAADHNTAEPGYGFVADPLHSPGASYFGFLTAIPTPSQAPDPTAAGDDPADPATDPPPPTAEVSAQQGQRAGRRVKLAVSCEQSCMAAASGRIVTRGGTQGSTNRARLVATDRKRFELRPARSQIAAGETVKLKLKPTGRKVKRRLRKAMRQGARAKAKISVTTIDALGSSSTVTVQVRLLRTAAGDLQ